MIATQHRVTAAELAARPDDGHRYELVAGELIRMSPAKPRHGWITARLTGSLEPYVREHRLGAVFGAETGFQIARNPDTVRAPDVAFVRRERVEAIGDTDDWWPGAPDLVIEVISAEDRYTEVRDKVMAWLKAGTELVLVVNPRRREVEAYRAPDQVQLWQEQDQLDGATVVPGWSLPVADLFTR